MLSTSHSSSEADWIIELNILGSTLPSATILEWISIATFALALGLAIGQRLSMRWQNVGLGLLTPGVNDAVVKAKTIAALTPESHLIDLIYLGPGERPQCYYAGACW